MKTQSGKFTLLHLILIAIVAPFLLIGAYKLFTTPFAVVTIEFGRQQPETSLLVPSDISRSDIDYRLEISGTPKLRITGICHVLRADNTIKTIDAGGIVPRTIPLYGISVSCAVQKDSEQGRIEVELKQNGAVIADSRAWQPFGIASVANY